MATKETTDLVNSLHHGFCLAGRIVRPEILELLHILFHCQQLRLKLVAETRQCVSDVVGELLIQSALKVWRSHSIGHVSVNIVAIILFGSI